MDLNSETMTALNTLRTTVRWRKDEELENLTEENNHLCSTLQLKSNYLKDFVHRSAIMKEIVEQGKQIARSNRPVLITGEPGVGKTHFAKVIHAESQRASRFLVEIDCARSGESQLSNQLFGLSRQVQARREAGFGAFDTAQHGTMILRHAERLSYDLQFRIAEAIETNSFVNNYGTIPHPSDVRIILTLSISFHDLQESNIIHDRLLRLFKENIIELPSLSLRLEDIESLVRTMSTRRLSNRGFYFEPEAIDILKEYPWPGNVRELMLIIDRCLMLSNDNCITAEIIHDVIGDRSDAVSVVRDPHTFSLDVSVSSSLREIKLQYIKRILRQVHGNRKQASEILGLTTRTLQDKVKIFRDQEGNF